MTNTKPPNSHNPPTHHDTNTINITNNTNSNDITPDKKWVWVPHNLHTFIPAYILTTDQSHTTVMTQDNTRIKISTCDIQKMNPPKFSMVSDLSLLSHLNEPSVLFNLSQRYDHDLIYTYSGLFLLAINPYKEIRGLYGVEMIEKYKNNSSKNNNSKNSSNNVCREDIGGNSTGRSIGSEVQPHIFAVANDAYNSMLLNRENQSVLITGESGAGKTENTKKVIGFLAHIASNKTNKGVISKDRFDIVNNVSEYDSSEYMSDYNNDITDKILETNVVLEAFGNAQTVKNDNSSRFGKFIKIEFMGGRITGAYIEKYLLEKSRVTRVNGMERNYHIFYQLIQALSNKKQKKKDVTNMDMINDTEYNNFLDTLRKDLLLDKDVSLNDFSYLKNTNKTITNINDAQEFYKLNKSMTILEFTTEERTSIFKIVSAVLHLGNLKFEEENDQAVIVNMDVAEKVCHLLKINTDNFASSLLTPIIRAGNENVINSCTKEQVTHIVEALARLLYERMFDTVVDKINSKLKNKNYYSSNFIGVVDIAGFEIFEKNDFEQFCINYTNEKLQQFFNHHMFILEQEIYRRENIEWSFIDFGLDLQPTIDLIEKSNPIGILSFLDEECVMPRGCDLSFLSKLREISRSSNTKTKDMHNISRNIIGNKIVDSNYIKDDCKDISGYEGAKFEVSRLRQGFILDHYAGKVEYIVEDWLKKNKDPHFDYLSVLLAQSGDPYVQNLFCVASKGKKGFFRTVSQKHKDSLNLLMQQLRKTHPYFVRCIIPNNEKKSNSINNSLVLHQLRCNGVMEGIRISRQGYPTRMVFKEFRRRYEMLDIKDDNEEKGFEDNKEVCLRILKNIMPQNNLNRSNDELGSKNTDKILKGSSETLAGGSNLYKIGNTMLFFRQGVLAEIEDLRDKKIDELAIELQSLIRRKLTVKKYYINEIREKAVKVIQKNARLCIAFKNWKWWKLYQKVKPLLEITKMDEELKIKDNKIEQANEQIRNERTRTEEVLNRLSCLDVEKKRLEEELEKERICIAEREELLTALRNENSNAKEKLEEEIRKNNEINDILRSKEDKICGVEEKYNLLEDDKNTIKDKLNNTQINLNNKEREIENMQTENKKLEEQVISLKVELNNTKNKSKDKIENLLLDKEKEIASLKYNNELKNKKVDELSNKMEMLNNELINVQVENKKKDEMLDIAKKENQIKISILEDELKENKINLEDLKSKYETNKENIGNVSGLNDVLKKEAEDLTLEIETLKKEIYKHESKNSKNIEINKELEDDLHKERTKYNEIFEKYTEQKLINNSLNESLNEEKSKNELTNSTHGSLIDKIKKTEEAKRELIEELEDERLKCERLANEKERLNVDNKKLVQSKLDDIFKRESEFNNIKKGLQMQIQKLEMEKLKNDETEKIEMRIMDIETEKRKKIEKLLVEQENKNLELVNKVETLGMENESNKNNLRTYVNKYDDLEKRLKQYTNIKDEIERIKEFINEKMIVYNKTFYNMIESYRKEKVAFEMDNLNLSKKIGELNSVNEKYINSINEMNVKLTLLENIRTEEAIKNTKKIDEINAFYQDVKDENMNMKKHINELNSIISNLKHENINLVKENSERNEVILRDNKKIENDLKLARKRAENFEELLRKSEEKIIGLKNSFGERNNKMYLCNKDHSNKNVDTENKGTLSLINHNENISSSNDPCSIEKCVCSDGCEMKCSRDIGSLKIIMELRMSLEYERSRNRELVIRLDGLTEIYNKFSNEFDLLVAKEKEMVGDLENRNKEIGILSGLVEIKNNELLVLKNDVQSLRNDIGLHNSVIKSLEYQNSDAKKKNEMLAEKMTLSLRNDEVMVEKNRRETLEQKIHMFENEINRTRKTNEDLMNNLSMKEIECNDIGREVGKWKEELLDTKKNCNGYLLKINQLERELVEEKTMNEMLRFTSVFRK